MITFDLNGNLIFNYLVDFPHTFVLVPMSIYGDLNRPLFGGDSPQPKASPGSPCTVMHYGRAQLRVGCSLGLVDGRDRAPTSLPHPPRIHNSQIPSLPPEHETA